LTPAGPLASRPKAKRRRPASRKATTPDSHVPTDSKTMLCSGGGAELA
jgi:hypothetical protein